MEEEVAKFIPCLILSCLQHTNTHFYFKDELSKLVASDKFESISDSLMHFYIAFDAEYKRIIEKVFEDPSFMKSKSRFLIKIGSRCLKMSDKPTFFNFLLMCAFIGRVVSFCYTKGKCYRVAENACKCALAIIERKFLELFNLEGGISGLHAYSNILNETVLQWQDQYDDLKDILCPDLEGKQLVLRLLDNCRDDDSSQYFLTDFERNILYKVTQRRLKKLKPNLDFLIHRIPRKYSNMQKNQGSRNIKHHVFGSNLTGIESSRSVEYSLRGYNPVYPPSSVSFITDSCSLPIDYTITKRDFESLNCNTIENQPELPNCSTNEKLSELSNHCAIEKPNEPLKCSITENNSDSLDCYIIEKRFDSSSSCVVEKTPEVSNCCITLKEIEPLNYCIAKKFSKLSIEETRQERSLLLVCHETSQEMHSENCEPSKKQLESSTRFPQMLKRSFSVRSMNSEFSNKGDRIRSPDDSQIVTSLETDAASVPKRRKTSNSLESKLPLETDICSSQKQFYPHILCSSEKTIYMHPRVLTFEELPNAKRGLFQMEAELPKKYLSKCRIPSNEDYSIKNYLSVSFSNKNDLPLDLRTETIFPSSIDSSQKSLTNKPHSPQEQNLAKVHHDKPSLQTQAEMASASYSFDFYDGEHNQISRSLLSSESSATNSQSSSEGYYTSESDFSDESENEDFQNYLPQFHSSEMFLSDSSPSESEYYFADWERDVTLINLMYHQCFHCKTKCFNYITHVFQQFTSHFID